LSSSVFYPCTAGQASSGTQTIIPGCHVPTEKDGIFEIRYMPNHIPAIVVIDDPLKTKSVTDHSATDKGVTGQ